MKRDFKSWLLFLWVLRMLSPDSSAGESQASEPAGPFPIRNYNPVQLLFLSLPSEKATTLSRGSYEVSFEGAESNTILIETTSRVDALLKFETFRSALHVKYGLTDRFEIGLEFPYFYRDDGFMDPFIMSVEEAFSNLNPNRLRFSNGSFGGYTIRLDGKIILSGGNNQTGPGDLIVSEKYLALQEGPERPALSFRGAIKLPTGNFDQAFGSGKPELGFGIVIQKTLSSLWVFYLNQNAVLPGGHFGTSDLTLNPIYTTAVILEFLLNTRFSIVGQFDYYTSPFHDTGTHLLDDSLAEGALGFNFQIIPQILWQFYGIDNFQNPKGAAADFTLGTNIAIRL